MVTAQRSDTVERQIRIAARPEIVFPFLIDPEKMVRWMGVSAESDPTPGGVYRVNVTGRHTASGRFLEVTPTSRVVFTWGWEEAGDSVPPGSSTVEIFLEPDGDGTLLRLRHSGLPLERRESHGQGWQHYLDRLTVTASGGDAGADPWTDAGAAADGSTAALVGAYYDSWKNGIASFDAARLRGILAPDLRFDGPIAGKREGLEPFLGGLEGFVRLLKTFRIVQILHAGEQASALYDCTLGASSETMRFAEFFRVQNGMIQEIALLFDATEFRRLAASTA